MLAFQSSRCIGMLLSEFPPAGEGACPCQGNSSTNQRASCFLARLQRSHCVRCWVFPPGEKSARVEAFPRLSVSLDCDKRSAGLKIDGGETLRPRQHTATLHHCFKCWYLLGVSQLGVTHAWLASVFQDFAGDIQSTTCLQRTEVDYYVTLGSPHIWQCVEVWRLRLLASLPRNQSKVACPHVTQPFCFYITWTWSGRGICTVTDDRVHVPTRHSSWSHSRLWQARNWVCWVTPQNPPPHEHATRVQRWDRAPPQQMAPRWEDTCGEEITAYGWDNAVPDSTPPTMFIMSCSWCSLPCLRSCWMCFD